MHAERGEGEGGRGGWGGRLVKFNHPFELVLAYSQTRAHDGREKEVGTDGDLVKKNFALRKIVEVGRYISQLCKKSEVEYRRG